MLLTTGAVIEFVKFIQILCWIILPFLLVAISLTTYLHYRKKKRNIEESELLESTSPEKFNFRRSNGEYILFDHSALIGEYKKRISSNQAKYTALRQDFSQLESRYSALAHFTAKNFKQQNHLRMENFQDHLPQHLQEEINLLVQEHAAEKKELLNRIEQLGRSYESLEEENESLLEQINSEHGSEEDKESLINKWQAENQKLKERVAEQDYLKEILEEKKAQINFLQNQLEQRIVQHHQTDQQCNQLQQHLQDLKQFQDGAMGAMQLEIKSLTDELDQFKSELTDKQKVLGEKERLLKESNEQYRTIETQYQQLEEKFLAGRQTIRRLYSELSASIALDEVPVIPMRADYNAAEESAN